MNQQTSKLYCPHYCGVMCVNGNCPNALLEEYNEYVNQPTIKCSECWYYRGCEDCYFDKRCEIQNGEIIWND